MKLSQLMGERFKETPADCQIASHALMIRGGYIKHVGNGIYSLFTPAKRIMAKIEKILREEMDRIGGQEVLFPVSMPAALWQESGRFEAVGPELLRFKDRGGNDMVLGMTHEEAAVHLARGTVKSYQSLPFMIYQIQTKFRDEPRARGGLIRVREFTMKDGYSFHTSQEDLADYYKEVHAAYERIFARVGIPEVISVASDSGMMGGKVSHEFMLLTEIGEDTLCICESCDFRSNMDVCECVVRPEPSPAEPLSLVHTPGCKTIEEVAAFLGADAKSTCKAVVYRKNSDDSPVIVFLRGDLEVNETKLRNYLKEEIHPAAELSEGGGIVPGFIGPAELKTTAAVVFDRSLLGCGALICGGNKADYHYRGFCPERDIPAADYIDAAKAREGGGCPKCGGETLKVSNGIEVGNIFQLGDKYTVAMGMQYADAEGALRYPVMGCYGIGVGRLAASVCEAHNDKYGPVWPISIAPWQAHICAIRSDEPAVRQAAEGLYKELLGRGVEVVYDDRPVSAGVMFSDADLLGIPVRVIVSPKTLERGAAEITTRTKSLVLDSPLEKAAGAVEGLVKDMLEKLG
ncbi:MAG: proline--tRNA ligase [Oscillospiraceae bacterium]|jgi:prolyl-tRNA synthetase|nr:proline--tRNA ligase [Oscillospiraceae bacterium]